MQKIEKNSKNQSEIAACEQKTTSEKANFCSNTVFSLYIKIRAKKCSRRKTIRFPTPAKQFAFSLVVSVPALPKSQLPFDYV